MDHYFSALTELRRGDSMASALTAERIEAIQEILRALWQGDNILLKGFRKKNGGDGVEFIPVRRVVRGGGGEGCPLGDLLPDPENEGKLMIRPGYVHGGGTSLLLEKGNITPFIGEGLYVEVDFTAVVEVGVMVGHGVMNSATIEQGGMPVVDDVITAINPNGKHRRTLGQWIDDGNNNPKWVPEGCGSYTFEFCRVFTGYRKTVSYYNHV